MHSPKHIASSLALSNIRREKKFFLPYIVASSGIIMMFYIMATISMSDSFNSTLGMTASGIMWFGAVIVLIFSAIFLNYINKFLMKRRNREMGIYAILGMEKRHIGRILRIETMVTTLISLVIGIVLGVIFSKLVYMILIHAIGGIGIDTFPVNSKAIAVTAIAFIALFALIYMKNRFQLHWARPIELLQGSDDAEREPKSRTLLVIAGIALLAYGYISALTISNAIESLTRFFFAVIAVIVGTYLLFTAVSIFILKRLKNNTAYYYRPGRFTSVSGLLFRMKQNAVGMANICILSTMVLVIISTTVCLHTGIDATIDNVTPMKNTIVTGNIISSDTTPLSDEFAGMIRQSVLEASKTNSTGVTKLVAQASLTPAVQLKTSKDGTLVIDSIATSAVKTATPEVHIITAKQYKRLTGKSLKLENNQALVYGAKEINTLKLNGLKFNVKQTDDRFLYVTANNALGTVGIVLNNEANISRVNKASGLGTQCYKLVTVFSVKGSDALNDAVRADAMNNQHRMLRKAYPGTYKDSYTMNYSKHEVVEELGGITNVFLFLGVFLGILFTLAATLIIYYKQISEGYYDRKNFVIMQKVGMSQAEVKRSIRTQVKLVFFAPLIAAACHMAGAFNMMNHLLEVFGLRDSKLFLECTGITLLAFTALYLIVYLLTSREYYRIVSWKAGQSVE